jgi:hypothetical protein
MAGLFVKTRFALLPGKNDVVRDSRISLNVIAGSRCQRAYLAAPCGVGDRWPPASERPSANGDRSAYVRGDSR